MCHTETVGISCFSKILHNRGMSNHMAPGGRAPSLPCWMKAALLSRLHGGGGGGDSPPINSKKKKVIKTCGGISHPPLNMKMERKGQKEEKGAAWGG